MAIFEKKIERKITLDDTEFIYCAIETSQKVNGHTVSNFFFWFLYQRSYHCIGNYMELLN